MDPALFETFVDVALRHGREAAVSRFRSLHPEHVQACLEEYERCVEQVKIGYPPKILAAPGSREEAWYPGPQLNDPFWPLFARYLREQAEWPDKRLTQLDEVSSKIVGFTSDPTQHRFRTQGLIVGYIQSGKTTNFTAVVSKAADIGYRVVIVLSGIHNGLRRQTQERLKEQLFDLHAGGWMELTDVDRDFDPPPGKAIAHIRPGDQQVVVFVVKKWHTVLKKLYAWLRDARSVLTHTPALIIDDEADQASVDTKTINPQIRKLLDLFPRCTYLGYTATPFANVLIDPSADDLYPDSFILSLPRPEGYFGTETIFGRDAVEGEAAGADLDGHDMVRIIPDEEVDLLRPKGRSAAGFVPELTDALESATCYFWLATAARRYRGDQDHSTMLVHASMKTAVHEAFRPLLENYRTSVLNRLRTVDGQFINRLRDQWIDESSRVLLGDHEKISFDELLPILPRVVQSTTVVLDNCRSKDRLDYSGRPVTAIAVGGNTLSRGLTLEGLVTSFFVRSASTYDTLMQMGRWFGYRPGYEDLPRIWMTERLRTWFRHLAAVEHEIRLDIERYEEQDQSPRDVGPRIRTHPVLNVTAKMGAARIAYASYGGRRVQTRYFRENDISWLRANLAAARKLIGAAIADGIEVTHRSGQAMLTEVDVRLVLEFLGAYQVHGDSPDLDTSLIAKYIRKETLRSDPTLLAWTVAVMGSPVDIARDVVNFADGVSVGTINRSKLKDTGGPKADIKTLMSKEHRVVDLDIEPSTARSMSESALIEMRDRDPIRRRQGLLLLYPIAKDSPPDEANQQTRNPLEAGEHIVGVAMVFPGNAEDAVPNVGYIQVDARDAELDASDREYERVALSADEL